MIKELLSRYCFRNINNERENNMWALILQFQNIIESCFDTIKKQNKIIDQYVDLLERAEKRAETHKDMSRRWEELSTKWRKMYDRKVESK